MAFLETESVLTNHQSDDGHSKWSGAISKWALLALLSIMWMFNYAARTSITAVFPLLKTDLGFTDVGLGSLGSFFLWSYALASPFAGHLGDRLDKVRIVLGSLIGWSLVVAASAFVNTRWELLATRVILGLAESLFYPAALALIAEHHSAATLGTVVGVLGVGQYAGAIGGATVAGFLADRYGWRSSLLVLGISTLLIAIPGYLFLPVKKRLTHGRNIQVTAGRTARELSFVESSLQLLKIPSFLILASAGALTSIGAWIFANWLPLYFKETFAMSLAGAGFFGAAFINGGSTLGMGLGGVVSDRVARRGGPYRMLLQSLLILAAAPILMVFDWSRSLPVILGVLTLNSALRDAGDINMQPLLYDLAGQKRCGMAVGITNMMNCLAGGLGIFLAGLLKSRLGLAGIFAGTVGILILDALLLFFGFWVFLKRDLQKAPLDPLVAVPAP